MPFELSKNFPLSNVVLNRRLLVLRGGSPSDNNLIRSLKAGDPTLIIIGCNSDTFELKKSAADRNYLIPDLSGHEFFCALCNIIKAEQIDLVIPNSDREVLAISRLADRLPCRIFLPTVSAIEQCQDKYALASFLRCRGINTPVTYPINDMDEITEIFRQMPSHRILWCRVRSGSGSLGALPVKDPTQTRSWINYWQQMRGLPKGSFTLSEYLPGRDFIVQCLFKNGTPLMTKMFERLSYHTLNAVPSGVSSTSAVAKMVLEPAIIEMCIKAMLALDPRASGVFFADLKENTVGDACITEINAGRFSNLPVIQDLVSTYNMSLAYVRAAFDEQIKHCHPYGHAEDCYVMRGLDELPVVFQASALLKDIKDARGS